MTANAMLDVSDSIIIYVWARYSVTHKHTEEMHMCFSNTCYILSKSFSFLRIIRGEVQSIASSRHTAPVLLLCDSLVAIILHDLASLAGSWQGGYRST